MVCVVGIVNGGGGGMLTSVSPNVGLDGAIHPLLQPYPHTPKPQSTRTRNIPILHNILPPRPKHPHEPNKHNRADRKLPPPKRTHAASPARPHPVLESLVVAAPRGEQRGHPIRRLQFRSCVTGVATEAGGCESASACSLSARRLR